MKKMFAFVLLLLGLAVSVKNVDAAEYFTSSSTGLVVFSSVTTGPQSSAGGTIEITEVWLSTGYNEGTYFVCVETAALSPSVFAVGGSTTNIKFEQFIADQYVFPPLMFLPSTATVTGLPIRIDMRGTMGMYGQARTINAGLACMIQGPTAVVQKYTWTLGYDQPALRRR